MKHIWIAVLLLGISNSVFAKDVFVSYSQLFQLIENRLYDLDICLSALEESDMEYTQEGICSVFSSEERLKFLESERDLTRESESLLEQARKDGLSKVDEIKVKDLLAYKIYLHQALIFRTERWRLIVDKELLAEEVEKP